MTDANETLSEQQVTITNLSQSLQIGISQLNAMLSVTIGESGASFRELNDDIQDFFMWGLQEKAESLARMADDLCCTATRARVGVGHD